MPVTVDSTLIERPFQLGANSTGYAVNEIQIPNVAHSAGTGAGATVTIDFVATGPGLPSSYGIWLNPSQACAISWSSKTTTGFTVTLTPLSSSLTIAGGTIDVLIRWAA